MLYGLVAALGYGTADVMATLAARRAGVLRTLLAVQVVGMIAIGAVILATRTPPAGPAWAWGLTIALGGINFLGMVMLYRAFANGTLSIVSPIASAFAVVTAVLAFIGGERLPGMALLGTGILVLGVAFVTGAKASGKASARGVPEAIAAAMSLGAFYWGLGEVTPSMGPLWPVLVSRIVQAALAFGIIHVRPTSVPDGFRFPGVLYVSAGLLDTAALVAFNLGVESAYTTTTTAITSLYSVVTVFLAWMIFRDRLSAGQWGGVAAVIGGVLMVSISVN